MRELGKQTQIVLLCLVLILASVTVVFRGGSASTAQITNRSLTLVANGTTGGSLAGGVVKHHFQFTVPSVGNTNIGSIKFLYCTTASGACTTPTGLVTTTATLESEAGVTGFAIDTADVNG